MNERLGAQVHDLTTIAGGMLERLGALDVLLAELMALLQPAYAASTFGPVPVRSQHRLSRKLERDEAELLALLGRGYSIQCLSKRLFVSKSTVERRIIALCDTCGVANRSQLIIWGTLHGYCMLEEESELAND